MIEANGSTGTATAIMPRLSQEFTDDIVSYIYRHNAYFYSAANGLLAAGNVFSGERNYIHQPTGRRRNAANTKCKRETEGITVCGIGK